LAKYNHDKTLHHRRGPCGEIYKNDLRHQVSQTDGIAWCNKLIYCAPKKHRPEKSQDRAYRYKQGDNQQLQTVRSQIGSHPQESLAGVVSGFARHHAAAAKSKAHALLLWSGNCHGFETYIPIDESCGTIRAYASSNCE
jgi:hypothetical protein